MADRSLILRLKERKLFQWAVAYLCGAWVAVEATNLVVEQFGWSIKVAQVITVLAFFGLFIVIVIAWYHGEKGRQWVSGAELLIIALLLLISGGVLSILNGHGSAQDSEAVQRSLPNGDEKPAIAVLPCANMSPDGADEYLALGVHDEILLQLQKIPSLLSIGRTSVLQYAENPPATDEIASALGVQYVGECSVRKGDDRIRVIFQLLAGETGEQVWAEDFDRNMTVGDLIDIQAEIARRVAQEVGAVLTPGDSLRVKAIPTEITEAYRLYLEARYWLPQRTRQGFERAVALFSEAVFKDDQFSLGYAGLASAYSLATWYDWGLPASTAHERATEAVRRALELDPNLPEAHIVLGNLARHRWDWEDAEIHYLRALELAPTDSEAHRLYGVLLLHLERFPESFRQLTRAVELDPLSEMGNYNLGDLLSAMGRPREAIGILTKNHERHPDHRSTINALQRALFLSERYEEAIDLAPNSSVACFSKVALGKDGEVRQQIADLESQGRTPSALAFMAIGDYDRVFEVLTEAVGERRASLAWTSVDPLYSAIHNDPRWGDFRVALGKPRES